MRRLALSGLALALCLSAAATACAAASPKLFFVSPLPFGVDVYLKMVRSGAEAAGRSLAMPTRVFESSDPETRAEDIRAAIREGATIIVVTGFEFADIVPDAADDNPAIRFLMVDECPTEPAPNVYCVLFKEYEANFLAGYEAALVSRSGKVGTVASSDIPYMHRYSDAFAQGARLARTAIVVAPTLWVGGDSPFSDPVRAESQAATMLSEGVDRLLAATSAGNGGVFRQVAATPGAQAFGVDINQCKEAPGHIVDSAVKHVDRATEQMVEAIARGTAPNRAALGLKEGAVGLTALEPDAAHSGCLVAGRTDILARVAAIRDEIVAGRLVVADPMRAAP
nr:BMP family ABC transporter substrate-binding protein [uncultured Lichenicoccus sp.]